MVSTNRPLWRWWLFCLASSLYFRTSWEWPLDLLGWCVLPEWLGAEDFPKEGAQGGEPF